MSRQKRVMTWAAGTFGSVALSRSERAARVVEEAIELAQAENLPKEVAQRILDRVYSRPVGHTPQEVGGLMITLEALAENIGLSVDELADAEFDRVLSTPAEHFHKKQAEKVTDGVSTAYVGRQR